MFKIIILFLTLSIYVYADNVLNEMIRCEPFKMYKCDLNECIDMPIVSMDEAQYFEIYPKKKILIGRINETTLDSQKIVYIKDTKKNLVFFGTDLDSPYNWVLRISKKDSTMTLASSQKGVSYTIFGICK